MPVVACRDCGQQVSTSAPTCPHCGALNPAVALSTLIIHRNRSMVGQLNRMVVYVDDVYLGELGNDDTLQLNLLQGVHSFRIKGTVLGSPTKDMSIRVGTAKVHKIDASWAMFGVKIDFYTADH